MKKKTLLVSGSLVLGCLLILVIGAVALTPLIESKVQGILQRTLPRVRNIESLSFSRLEFSPFSCNLTLYDVKARYKNPAGLQHTIKKIELDIPLRFLLANIASTRPYVLPSSGSMTVCNAIDAEGISFALAKEANGHVKAASLHDVTLRADHLAALLQKTARPAPLELAEGASVGLISLNDMTANLKSTPASLSLGHFRAENFASLVLERLLTENLRITSEKGNVQLAQFEIRDLRGPDSTLMQQLQAIPVDEKNLEKYLPILESWFYRAEPPVKNIAIKDFSLQESPSASPIALTALNMGWLSNNPWHSTMKVENLALPTSLLESNGIRLPGLSRFSLSINAETQQEQKLFHDKGILSIEGIGDLAFDASFSIPDDNDFSFIDIFNWKIHKAHFQFTDRNFLAYLAINQDDPEMAVSAFRQSVQDTFPAQEMQPLCNALQQFIEYPGKLVLNKGNSNPVALQDLLDMRSLPYLWQVEVTPGTESLGARVRKLRFSR